MNAAARSFKISSPKGCGVAVAKDEAVEAVGLLFCLFGLVAAFAPLVAFIPT